MTFKQRKLIANIKNSDTLMEAGIKAGYSPKAGNVYNKAIKSHVMNYLDKVNPTAEQIVSEFIQAIQECKTDNDRTNLLRALEDLARIKAMFISKAEITTVNEDKSQYINRLLTLPTENS